MLHTRNTQYRLVVMSIPTHCACRQKVLRFFFSVEELVASLELRAECVWGYVELRKSSTGEIVDGDTAVCQSCCRTVDS